jgi:hypothetical protein
VLSSSTNSSTSTKNNGSPLRGVSMASTCADAANSAARTTAPFALARIERELCRRRAGSSAPLRTSATISIVASTSENRDGGTSATLAPMWAPASSATVSSRKGSTIASRTALTSGS